jgi:hypothetical protein
MFIKIINGKPQKYSFVDLRKDNPHTVFPFPDGIDSESLIVFDCFLFIEKQPPQYDMVNQKLLEGEPILEDGKYIQNWVIEELTEQEKNDMIRKIGDEVKEKRRKAYQKYSDPLYFKWQRGDGSEEEYINMFESIKQQLPYPQGYDG